MRRYLTEIITLLLQLLMFYIFPLFAGPSDAMGMVLLIIIATFLLSLFLGLALGKMIKLLYPPVIAVLFILSVFIYYNISALVHSVWYLVISLGALLFGSLIRAIVNLTLSQPK